MKYKKTFVLCSLLLSSQLVHAEASSQQEVDPADLTKVNTSVFFGMNNHNQFKVQGSVAGQYESGNGYMLLGEANMDEDGKYGQSRVQYFHTTDTGWGGMPKAAASLDIIDNDLMTSTALGGISLITSPWKNVMFFPQAAYVHGNLKSDFVDPLPEASQVDKSLNGVMAAFYTSIRFDDQGSFVMFYPEYTRLYGDADIEVKKLVASMGTPISAERNKWLMLKIESSETDVEIANRSLETQDDTTVTFSFRMFF